MEVNITINFNGNDFATMGQNVSDLVKLLTPLLAKAGVNINQTQVAPKTEVKVVKEESYKAPTDKRKQKRTMLTYEQVVDLYLGYEEATKDKGMQGVTAIRYAIKSAKLSITEATAHKVLFDHKHMLTKDGKFLDDIEIPTKVSARPSTFDPEVRRRVAEVKYLRDRKNCKLEKVVQLTHEDPLWARRVYDNYTYTDIMINREVEMALDEKYKNLVVA